MRTRLLLLLAFSTGLVTALDLSAVEPPSIGPYEPAVLELAGEGFQPSCKAMLEKRGRYVPVKTEFVDSTALRAVLAAGLGPEPAARKILVRCGGERSRTLTLQITPVARSEELDGPTESDPAQDAYAGPSGEAVGPVAVERLDPAAIPAGKVFTLTLLGNGFTEGARVGILANVNAGTSRTPQYASVEFEAEFASDTVLIVDFDRAFAASPRLRPIVVTNPDGGQSPPVYLEITRRSP